MVDIMTPLGFLLRIVFGLIAFTGLVLVFALFQHWIETGLDDGPPGPPAGDVPPKARQ